VVVLVGTVAFGHLTEAGQVIVLPAVASLVSTRVNEYAPEETPVMLNVNVQLPVKVAVTKFPFASVNVSAVPVLPAEFRVSEGAVRIGVANVGDVPNTRAPEPVSLVTAAAKFADEGVARKVATLAARPETPVEIGNPVQLVRVPAEGVPMFGVVSDGDVANTAAPEPVSSVKAAAKFADEGVAKNVATLAPSPETPVEIGNPVQLVRVPEEGVPRTGVVKVGDVRVLLVRVSVPANVAKSASVTAVLNCAIVPVKVLLPRAMDLLVSVCAEAIPATVSEPPKNVAVPDAAAGATTVVVPAVEPARVKPPEPMAGVVRVLLVSV